MKKTLICVPTWNRTLQFIETLESIVNFSDKETTTIVVVNDVGSRGHKNALKKYQKIYDFELINKIEKGYTRGTIKDCYKLAVSDKYKDYDYFALVESDMPVSNKWINRCIATMNKLKNIYWVGLYYHSYYELGSFHPSLQNLKKKYNRYFEPPFPWEMGNINIKTDDLNFFVIPANNATGNVFWNLEKLRHFNIDDMFDTMPYSPDAAWHSSTYPYFNAKVEDNFIGAVPIISICKNIGINTGEDVHLIQEPDPNTYVKNFQ